MAYQMLETEEEEVRIALVGRTGVGKSAAGNTILGRPAFPSKLSSSSVTSECKKESGVIAGQTVSVVDTPGLFETNREETEVKKEIAQCISFAAPGPHVFLIVLQLNRFTEEEQKTVKILQTMFGEQARKYTMALFTHGNVLKENDLSIREFIDDNPDLSNFIGQCGGGYHVFDNQDQSFTQVTNLVRKIKAMLKRNGGSFYTNQMFAAAEGAIREETERLRRSHPGMDQREARRRAERHNSFISNAMKVVGVGTISGLGGAAVGAAVGSVLGPVGAAAGAKAGAVVGATVGAAAGAVGAAVVILREEGVCVIQ